MIPGKAWVWGSSEYVKDIGSTDTVQATVALDVSLPLLPSGKAIGSRLSGELRPESEEVLSW